MASEQTVLDVFARALWEPTPTIGSDLKARQLAAALGYPPSFRVVRTIETTNNESRKNQKVIVDRIYSDKPDTGCDMWYNHEAALKAAEAWPVDRVVTVDADGDLVQEEVDDEEEIPSPHHFDGGHMLPRQPLFSKGDKVQALYDGDWWDATILKRKQNAADKTYTYQVQYKADGSRQSNVVEELIRRRVETVDPKKVAVDLGLGEGWEAVVTGNNRYKILAPDGQRFASLKRALAHHEALIAAAGDPPWRTSGSDYIGRRVVYTIQHKPSSRRTIDVTQVGTVVGYIRETDIDRKGDPGFVSERTGKPARLYHVEFDTDQHHHQAYGNLMIKSQDFEEFELLEILDDESAVAAAAAAAAPSSPASSGQPSKKAKTTP